MDRPMRLCTICARGGSKGIKGKNLRPLSGLPLIAHSVRAARGTGLFTVTAVSSDDSAILDAAAEAGADILVERPYAMASDTAAKVPAIHHCVSEVEARTGRRFSTLVDLDATSPLRLPEDIEGAVRLLETTGSSSVITASPSRRSPYFNLVETDLNGVVRLSKALPDGVTRRQDAPASFDMNASVYVWQRDIFMRDPKVFYENSRLYVMPEERSHDIDSELDFEIVQFLFERLEARK